MFSFYTPWKPQKIKGFLVFLVGIKWEDWPEMDLSYVKNWDLRSEINISRKTPPIRKMPHILNFVAQTKQKQ